MSIPSTLILEDEDGNAVEMAVIGSATAKIAGEERTYLALFPAEALDSADQTAMVVRFLSEDEAIVAIESDDEFDTALTALDMDNAEEPADASTG